jgi:hypothetical protein
MSTMVVVAFDNETGAAQCEMNWASCRKSAW